MIIVLFEPPMENWHSGITLKGLTKNYGKNKAVKNLNAEFYEGQVTALLGHNGAAKTTTLYVLCRLQNFMYHLPLIKLSLSKCYAFISGQFKMISNNVAHLKECLQRKPPTFNK